MLVFPSASAVASTVSIFLLISSDGLAISLEDTEIIDDLKPLLDFQADSLSLEVLSEIIEKRLIPHLIKYAIYISILKSINR